MKIGRNITLGTGTQILGEGIIGDNVSFGGNVSIYNQDIKSNSLVYNKGGSIIINKRKNVCSFQKSCFKLIK